MVKLVAIDHETKMYVCIDERSYSTLGSVSAGEWPSLDG